MKIASDYKSNRVEMILDESQVPSYVMDLLHDKNPAIRDQAMTTLGLIMDYDNERKENGGTYMTGR